MTKTLIILFIGWLSITSSAQTLECDTIYDTMYSNPETMPQYETGEKGIIDYTFNKLIPIFNNCFTKDDEIITGLLILLTIDSRGNVVSVDFPNLQVALRCKDKLIQELLAMPGWKPGKISGHAVCTKVALPVRCLKWE